MPKSDNVNAECDVFSRYLTGCKPDDYVLKKYTEAFLSSGVLERNVDNKFDRFLLNLALLHPFFTHIADIYSRFFRSDSIVRKRLVLLLAILESWAPSYKNLDNSGANSKAVFFISMLFRGVFMVSALVLSAVTLFPIQIIMSRKTAER